MGVRMGQMLLSQSGIWPLGAFALGMLDFHACLGPAFIPQQDIEIIGITGGSHPRGCCMSQPLTASLFLQGKQLLIFFFT